MKKKKAHPTIVTTDWHEIYELLGFRKQTKKRKPQEEKRKDDLRNQR